MRAEKKFKTVLLCAILLTLSFVMMPFLGKDPTAPDRLDRTQLGTLLSEPLLRGELPKDLQLMFPVGGTQVRQADLSYTLDLEAQSYISDLISRYKPDFASFVALDAETGRIISLVSYQRDPADQIYGNLAFRAIFPAASIFKVVTATAAIDLEMLRPDSMIAFNGGSHTLYKRNVTETKYNRWTRTISFREAFAKSINTVFGKVGAFHVGPKSLLEYAGRFQFDKTIPSELPIEMGSAFKFDEASEPFEIAEVASGFNKESRMSPIQGALIASAVANDGVMMHPYLVEQLLERDSGRVLYQHQAAPASVTMRPESARKLRDLMNETVEAGTSQKSFRQVFGRKLEADGLELGGKTGSLTARNPDGKIDWFVGYARNSERKVAIAAMTLHKKYWTVKSSYLGASFFEHYFKLRKLEGARALNPLRKPASEELRETLAPPPTRAPVREIKNRAPKKKRAVSGKRKRAKIPARSRS